MKLLYEDKEIIVCEKPAGTASQNERGFTADMVSLLMTHEKESGVKQPYIGVVHRLDKMVGGVMVYAKNKSAAANLSKQIAQHKVKKKYYAVVMGIPETQNGVMEDYLVRDGRCICACFFASGKTKDGILWDLSNYCFWLLDYQWTRLQCQSVRGWRWAE